ncbi:hypothetical protein [Halopseudomonas sp.]|uniref:hypothetical protein n=1 Tax=Halopseudomonas sp. TaxID=2901191 RepID=UPI00356579AD
MKRVSAVLILLVTLASPLVGADLAVVAHPDSQVVTLDRAQLINIYMGRYRQFPTGESALPVDLSPLKERFYRALVSKDLAEINSYWARLVFSGQVSPPLQLQSAEDVLEYVRRNPGALGFVDAAEVPADIKVVARIAEVAP